MSETLTLPKIPQNKIDRLVGAILNQKLHPQGGGVFGHQQSTVNGSD
ncbi:MAG: hypothetical protein HEQ35_07800 [Gloeotrichia echinulata IR180]